MHNNTIIKYLQALLNHYKLSTAKALSELLGNVSHDTLTRLIHKDFDFQKLLYSLIGLCCILKKGYLIIDDTWLPKAYCDSLTFVKKQYSGRYGVPLMGLTIVVIIWTDGFWRIPLGLRIWKKGGKTKPDLALELLSEVRNKLKLKPEMVLFDCSYSKGILLKRLDNYGWAYVCGVSSLKYFKGEALKRYKTKTNWYSRGVLWYGRKALLVRSRGKFYATNRLSWTPEKLKAMYGIRFTIEEFFKILKQECGVSCQVRDEKAYSNHLHLCFMNFINLEHWRVQEYNKNNIISIYKIRKSILPDKRVVSTNLLKRFSKLCVT